MVEPNTIIGIIIIIINLIPLILKRPRLLIITGGISVMLAMMLLAKIF